MAKPSLQSTLRFISLTALLMLVCSESPSLANGISPERRISLVRKTIESHPIVIFSKSYCPYCKRAKSVFRELKQEAFIVELDEQDDGQEVQQAVSEIVGRRTVPQVFINGKHIGGSDDTVEAYESGQLADLLGIDYEDEL